MAINREVLVFWCFKSVRWTEFCLLELVHHRAFAAPYRPEHLYTPSDATKSYKISYKALRYPSDTLCTCPDQSKTLSDTNRHQRAPTDTSKRHSTPTWTVTHPQTAFWGVWGCVGTSIGVCWSLLLKWIVRRWLRACKLNCLYFCWVWVGPRVYMSVPAL